MSVNGTTLREGALLPEIRNLEAGLQSNDPDQRLAAIAGFTKAGGLGPLCRALNHHDEQVRVAAARALGTLGEPAIEALEELLLCGDLLQRKTVAWALGFCGPEALPSLLQALRDSRGDVRRAAVKSLGRLQVSEATPELCRMLRDRKEEVRLAAIRALGETGDERAVGPLNEILRSCFVARSARRQLLIGTVVAVSALAALVVCIGSALVLPGAGLAGFTGGVVHIFVHYWSRRRQTGQLSRTVTRALVQIGERTPTPDLRIVLPDLRVVAKDRLQHDPCTREASRTAVQRIEALTESLKDLPVPGSASSDKSSLPRVGEPPAPDAERLPRVR